MQVSFGPQNIQRGGWQSLSEVQPIEDPPGNVEQYEEVMHTSLGWQSRQGPGVQSASVSHP